MGLVTLRDDTSKLAERLGDLKALSLYVGYQGSDGAAIHAGSTITVAKLAAVQEWGASEEGIPARSYIRRTMLEKRAEIGEELKRAVAACIEGKTTAVQAYSRVGRFVVGLIRDKLESASSWAPALDPETAEAKGHARPLDDTGQLSAALSWTIRRGRTVVGTGK